MGESGAANNEDRYHAARAPIVTPPRSLLLAWRRASHLVLQGLRGFAFAPGQAIACVVSLAVASCLVVLFVSFGSMAIVVLGRAVERARVIVYLKDDIPANSIETLMANIRKAAGIEDVEYVSREQDRARNASLLPSDLVERLPPEAIPGQHCLELTVRTPRDGDLAGLASYLKSLEGVDVVSEPPIGAVRLRSAAAAVAFARVILTVLGVILLASTLFFVVGTLNRSMERRREEMAILRLVGATEAFVRAPLYVQGVVQGTVGVFMGTLVALSIIKATNAYLSAGLGIGLRIASYPATTVGLGMLVGAIVGVAGAAIASMRRMP